MQIQTTPQVTFGRNHSYLSAEENEAPQYLNPETEEIVDSTKKVSVPAGVLAAALAGLLLTDCQNTKAYRGINTPRVSANGEITTQNVVQKKVTKDGIILTRNGETRTIMFKEFLKYEKDELRRDLIISYLKSENPELLWHASFEISKLFYGTYYGEYRRGSESMVAGPRTFAHELAHAMDHHSEGNGFTKFSTSKEFIRTANKEYDAYYNATNNDLRLSTMSTNELWAECAAIQMSDKYETKNEEALRTFFPKTMALVRSQMDKLNTLPQSQRMNSANISDHVKLYNPNDELTGIRYFDEDGNCVRVERKKTSGKNCIPVWLRPNSTLWISDPMENRK